MNLRLADAIDELNSGATTSEALVDEVLAARNTLGAVERVVGRARSLARASDARRRAGRTRGALDGVPFGVKANFDVEGEPTTSGFMHDGPIASRDARCVALLVALGAVPAVITTMAPAAFSSITVHPLLGVCRNPRDEGRHAGGSSGGSAAAVGSGLVPFALGSDTLGSVRIPAAYSGVVGWIPTHGAVTTRGLVPLAPPLDTVGMLTASASDLQLLAEPLFEPDPANHWWRAAPAHALAVSPRVADCTLAATADEAGQSAAEAVVEELVALGAVRRRTVMLPLEPREVRRQGLLLARVCAATTFRRQLEYGRLPTAVDDLIRSGAATSGPKLWSVLEQLVALRRRVRLSLLDVDYLVLPTTPNGPPRIGDDVDWVADLTAWVNVAGLPCVALPVGDRSVQIVGRPGADRDLIRWATLLSDQSKAGERRSKNAEMPS